MSRYAIILGGELRNCGAQAMSMQAVSAIKQLLPEIEPVLISSRDCKQPLAGKLRGFRDRKDLGNMAFKVAWGDIGLLYRIDTINAKQIESQVDLANMVIKTIVYAREVRKFHNLLDQAALCIDISGFAFGAQWGYKRCQSYLDEINHLYNCKIPIYILPQSFGPFKFPDRLHSEFLRNRAADILSFPRMICAREQQGYNDIRAICPEARITLEEDIVLQGGDIDLTSIFIDPSLVPARPDIITDRNVGVVPNNKIFRHGDEVRLLALYGSIIEGLLCDGYHVYVIRHSEDDARRCAQLKALFPDDPRVVLMNEDRYCFQYGELFERCDFLVASRFHSIVHAYRSGVPCVALGWATKYVELLDRFGQGGYVHDVRKIDDKSAMGVFSSVRMMEDRHEEEAGRIRSRVSEIQSGPSIFERVAEDFKGMEA